MQPYLDEKQFHIQYIDHRVPQVVWVYLAAGHKGVRDNATLNQPDHASKGQESLLKESVGPYPARVPIHISQVHIVLFPRLDNPWLTAPCRQESSHAPTRTVRNNNSTPFDGTSTQYDWYAPKYENDPMGPLESGKSLLARIRIGTYGNKLLFLQKHERMG